MKGRTVITIAQRLSAIRNSDQIVVLQDDSAKPILDAINGATKSLRAKLFMFSHPELLKRD